MLKKKYVVTKNDENNVTMFKYPEWHTAQITYPNLSYSFNLVIISEKRRRRYLPLRKFTKFVREKYPYLKLDCNK